MATEHNAAIVGVSIVVRFVAILYVIDKLQSRKQSMTKSLAIRKTATTSRQSLASTETKSRFCSFDLLYM